MTEYPIDNAIQFDPDITIYMDYAKTISILLYHRIQEEGGFKNWKYEEVFTRVIANLRLAYEVNRPLYYSRHKGYYPQGDIGYDVMTNLIDAMIKTGLIEHQIGKYDHIFHSDKSTFNKGYSSRMWVSSRNKEMFTIFTRIPVDSIIKEAPTPLVKLQTRKVVIGKKTILPKPIPYRRTHATNRMTKQLKQYNKMLADTNIELHVDWNTLDNNQRRKLVRFNYMTQFSKTSILYPIELKNFNWTGYYISGKNHTDIQDTVNKVNTIIQDTGYSSIYNTGNILYTDTVGQTHKHTTGVFYENTSITNQNDTRYSDLKVSVKTTMITHRFIGISFKYKSLHRSFTENFNQGGRYYGASWIDFHGNIRPRLFINGESVCEPDFSAYHLRMLYHELKIDYRDDAYLYETKELRPLAKACAMTLINCKTARGATNSVKKAFGYDSRRKHPIDYNNKLVEEYDTWIHNVDFINSLKEGFKKAHPIITEKYWYKDCGLRLQNIDSNITYNILNHFIEQDIPCLPVHDSFIVQQRHKKELIEVMSNEYEKIMNFKPVID